MTFVVLNCLFVVNGSPFRQDQASLLAGSPLGADFGFRDRVADEVRGRGAVRFPVGGFGPIEFGEEPLEPAISRGSRGPVDPNGSDVLLGFGVKDNMRLCRFAVSVARDRFPEGGLAPGPAVHPRPLPSHRPKAASAEVSDRDRLTEGRQRSDNPPTLQRYGDRSCCSNRADRLPGSQEKKEPWPRPRFFMVRHPDRHPKTA